MPGGEVISYSPESGFVVFWDFVTGLPESTEKLQVLLVSSLAIIRNTPVVAPLTRHHHVRPAGDLCGL